MKIIIIAIAVGVLAVIIGECVESVKQIIKKRKEKKEYEREHISKPL